MTLDQLAMFVAVVDTGTFSAAAKKLRISQPSISVAIKNLEDEFKIMLLERSGYRPTPTPEGQEMYRQAKRMLDLQSELKTTASLLAHGEERKLKIILDIVSPLPHILDVIQRYFAKEQTCKIELSFCVLGGGINDILSNRADLYIGPVFAEVELLSIRFHSQYHMVPVLARTHPDATRPREQLRKRLARIPRVILRSTERAEHERPNVDQEEREAIFVKDYLIKKETILAGLGWGRLPLWNIETELSNGLLMDVRDFFPHMKISGDVFVVPKAKNHGKHLSALLELLVPKNQK